MALREELVVRLSLKSLAHLTSRFVKATRLIKLKLMTSLDGTIGQCGPDQIHGILTLTSTKP